LASRNNLRYDQSLLLLPLHRARTVVDQADTRALAATEKIVVQVVIVMTEAPVVIAKVVIEALVAIAKIVLVLIE
jgi:hypothetical protein